MKFQLKAKRASKRVAAPVLKKVRHNKPAPKKLKVRVKFTPDEEFNLRAMREGRVGYHTKPIPGYIGVFDPSEPGRRPVPAQIKGESAQSFDDRWRRHYGIATRGSSSIGDNALPPLPAGQAYLRDNRKQVYVHTFQTPAEIKAREAAKALRAIADAKAETDRRAHRVILARGGHYKMRAKPQPKLKKFKLVRPKPRPAKEAKKKDAPVPLVSSARRMLKFLGVDTTKPIRPQLSIKKNARLANVVEEAHKHKLVVRPKLVPIAKKAKSLTVKQVAKTIPLPAALRKKPLIIRRK